MFTRFLSVSPLSVIVALVATMMLATTSVEVRPGDTLTQLAESHDVTVEELVAWNGIEDADHIVAGATLVLTDPSTTTPTSPSGRGGVEHAVTAGDTLWLIARRYGVSVATIIDANQLTDPDRIYVGQTLALDASTPASPSSNADDFASTASIHSVQAGETLFAIALRFGVKPDALAAGNALTNPNLIRVGQRLTIPGAPAPEAPAPTTTLPPAPPVPPSPVPTTTVPTSTVPTNPAPSTSATPLKDAFRNWSSSYGVPQDLLEALLWKESNWQPSVTGPGGHLGIGQLSPDTVDFVEERLLGLELDPLSLSDGVQMAARYLRYLIDRTHSEREALAAWNQGLHGLLENGMNESAAAFADSVLEIRRIRR